MLLLLLLMVVVVGEEGVLLWCWEKRVGFGAGRGGVEDARVTPRTLPNNMYVCLRICSSE